MASLLRSSFIQIALLKQEGGDLSAPSYKQPYCKKTFLRFVRSGQLRMIYKRDFLLASFNPVSGWRKLFKKICITSAGVQTPSITSFFTSESTSLL